MIKDIINSIKVQLYERATSPLLGAFIISWAIWNYRFLLVIGSSIPITEKLSIIDSIIFCSPETYYMRGAIYPLVTALAFIFLYPYPARWVYGYSRHRQRELKELRQQIDDETPLTKEESREIRREALNIERNLQSEIDRREQDIRLLKEEIERLSANTTEKEEYSKSEDDGLKDASNLNTEQLDVLRIVAKLGEWAPEDDVISKLRQTRVKAEFNIGELITKGFLTKNYRSGKRAQCLDLTHTGRTVLVNTGEYDQNV
ncbi:hypothetical protein [Nitrogeniibacter aestuarii]|uniref:hypothetical protein n=1 Tax=Nitrogeniibacter aestuarii TaxID=2815343 RepID=UPI001D1149C7|nr:hypothetical protein [Nitrogeniibacter aestuarii]